MCATCGCSDDTSHTVHERALPRARSRRAPPRAPAHPHDDPHAHGDDHSHEYDRPERAAATHHHDHPPHDHEPPAAATRTLRLEQDVLAKNNLLAERNRGWFAGRDVVALEPHELARERERRRCWSGRSAI